MVIFPIMRCFNFLLLAFAVVLTLPRPGFAQKLLLSSIQFKGAPEYSDQELLAAAGLKKGMILTTEELDSHGKHLMASGVFDNLAFKFDGADLVFSLTPAAGLYPVRIDNLPLKPGPPLDAQLHDRFPLYHGKVPSQGGLLDDVRQALVEMLATEGVKANVAAVPYSDKMLRDKVTAMSFTITAPEVHFGPVRIEGASEALLPNVQRIADFASKSLFDSETSAAKLEHNIALFYEDRGYAAVKVQAEQSGMPVTTADSIQVPYKVTVQEGKTYKLGSLRLPPGAIVTQEDVNKALHPNTNMFVHPGLGALLSVIDNSYKAKGYLDLVVTLHPQFDDAAAIVNYTVDIDPGPVYRVAYVKFDGVSDSLKSQLMRAWELMPGEPFDEPYLSRFISKVEAQDPVLKRVLVGMIAKYDITADPMTHEVNLVIRLEK